MDARSLHRESCRHDSLQYFAIGDVAPEDLRAERSFEKTGSGRRGVSALTYSEPTHALR